MAMIKQVILIREDLQFPRGLLAAQVAHIHALPIRHVLKGTDPKFNSDTMDDFRTWLDEPYVFIHGVPNKEVCLHLLAIADQYKVSSHVWRDTVYLEIGGTPVPFEDILVGASLGPCDSDKLKMVIGTLDLLR